MGWIVLGLLGLAVFISMVGLARLLRLIGGKDVTAATDGGSADSATGRNRKSDDNADAVKGKSVTTTTAPGPVPPVATSGQKIFHKDPDEGYAESSALWLVLPGLLGLGAVAWTVYQSTLASGIEGWQWLLWSLFGLGGLLAIFGLLIMSRHNPVFDEKHGPTRGLGFLTLLSGLILAGAGLIAWQPKIDEFGAVDQRLQTTQSSFGDLQQQNAKLQGELQGQLQATSGMSGEITRLTGEMKQLQSGRDDLHKENERLADQVTRLTAQMQLSNASREEVQRLNTVVARLEKENMELSDQIAELTQKTRSLSTSGEEVERLNAVIAGLNARLDSDKLAFKGFDEMITGLRSTIDAKEERIAELEASLAGRTQTSTRAITAPAPAAAPVATTPPAPPAAPPTAAPAVQPTTPASSSEDDAMRRLGGSRYAVEAVGTPELVRGKSGRFYHVKLRQPGGGNYRFAAGSYWQVDPAVQFRKSVDEAISDIAAQLAGRDYQLYIQGSASAGSYSGKRERGYQYKRIDVLPKSADGRYEDRTESRRFNDPIHNRDLPNLRSAFLQEYISRRYRVARPIILDGSVSDSGHPSEQAVELILYVEGGQAPTASLKP